MMAKSMLSAAAAGVMAVSCQAWAGTGQDSRCNSKAPASWAGKTTTWQITVVGQIRSFNVYLPSSFKKKRPNALVINYHPWSLNAGQWEIISNFSLTAEQHGFVVYPEALDTEFENPDGSPTSITSWNDHLGGSGSPGPSCPTCDPTNPNRLPVAHRKLLAIPR